MQVHLDPHAYHAGARKAYKLSLLLLALAVMVFVLGLGVGGSGWSWDADEWVWSIRAPRGAGAWLAGALLGLAGSLAQGLFRNPLAEPYLLGNAAGAALAFACGLAFAGAAPWLGGWLEVLGFTGLSFLGSMVAVLLTIVLAQEGGWRSAKATGLAKIQDSSGLRLLLAGVIVGVVLGALTALLGVRYPEILPVMQSFSLGATGMVNGAGVLTMALVWVVCLSVALLFARVLDALNLGEEVAHSLGLPVASLRWCLLVVVALATAAATAQTGLIAFVGLAAPHTVRTLFAPTRQKLLGAKNALHSGLQQRHIVLLSTLMGGLLLQGADLVARWWFAPQELPVGVLTAVLGGVYLLWLMHRGRV